MAFVLEQEFILNNYHTNRLKEVADRVSVIPADSDGFFIVRIDHGKDWFSCRSRSIEWASRKLLNAIKVK